MCGAEVLSNVSKCRKTAVHYRGNTWHWISSSKVQILVLLAMGILGADI